MSFWDRLLGREREPETVTDTEAEPAQVRLACLTDCGLRRKVNEDNYAFNGMTMAQVHLTMEGILTAEVRLSDHFRAALFDGMGGESAGDLASYIAAQNFERLAPDTEWDEETVQDFLRELNRCVLREADREGISLMGATAVAAQWNEDRVIVSNLGDSPAFLLREGEMTTLTEPDNSEQRYILPGDVGRKPGLTQFLGLPAENGEVVPHTKEFSPRPGDVCLLCSDGLTDMVLPDEIREVLEDVSRAEEMAEITEAADRLRKMALEAGGRDNITIILAQICGKD